MVEVTDRSRSVQVSSGKSVSIEGCYATLVLQRPCSPNALLFDPINMTSSLLSLAFCFHPTCPSQVCFITSSSRRLPTSHCHSHRVPSFACSYLVVVIPADSNIAPVPKDYVTICSRLQAYESTHNQSVELSLVQASERELLLPVPSSILYSHVPAS